MAILERVGLSVHHDPTHEHSPSTIMRAPVGDLEIRHADCPNIVPTLAAIGAYIDGRMRVVGGRLTRFSQGVAHRGHGDRAQARRVDIEVVHQDGVCDGFEVRGAASYRGGCTFTSWGDHRIFMSLFVAGLRMHSPCHISASRMFGFRFQNSSPNSRRPVSSGVSTTNTGVAARSRWPASHPSKQVSTHIFSNANGDEHAAN